MRIDALYDSIADIDYRFTFSPGAGYYFIKSASASLRAEVGPGYVVQRQAGKEDDYFTLRIAERYDQKINDRMKLWEAAEYLPQVDRFQNYIINAEIGIETVISKQLRLRTYLQDNFHSEPAAGRKKNDVKVVAAVAYKF
jgi:putative salt-induced outer membrane protein YdiY